MRYGTPSMRTGRLPGSFIQPAETEEPPSFLEGNPSGRGTRYLWPGRPGHVEYPDLGPLGPELLSADNPWHGLRSPARSAERRANDILMAASRWLCSPCGVEVPLVNHSCHSCGRTPEVWQKAEIVWITNESLPLAVPYLVGVRANEASEEGDPPRSRRSLQENPFDCRMGVSSGFPLMSMLVSSVARRARRGRYAGEDVPFLRDTEGLSHEELNAVVLASGALNDMEIVDVVRQDLMRSIAVHGRGAAWTRAILKWVVHPLHGVYPLRSVSDL